MNALSASRTVTGLEVVIELPDALRSATPVVFHVAEVGRRKFQPTCHAPHGDAMRLTLGSQLAADVFDEPAPLAAPARLASARHLLTRVHVGPPLVACLGESVACACRPPRASPGRPESQCSGGCAGSRRGSASPCRRSISNAPMSRP